MKTKTKKFVFAASLIFIGSLGWLSTQHTYAAPTGVTYTVNSTLDERDAGNNGICSSTPSGVCTLRAAIQEANTTLETDTIVLPAGTYVLTRPGNDNITVDGDLDVYTDMEIVGAGSDTTIINANRDVTHDRALHVHDENLLGGVEITLTGVTLRNGVALEGAGVLVDQVTLTLNDVKVEENNIISTLNTARGGGIENVGGTLTLNYSSVSDNLSTCNGCGVGAIKSFGGGIDNISGGTLVLNYSTVSDNTTGGAGGGLFNTGTVFIFNSTFLGNLASLDGGGIYTNLGSVYVVNSTLSGNGAWRNGGGIFVGGGPNIHASFFNSTIADNAVDVERDSTGAGGGVYSGDDVRLWNTILAKNYKDNGANGLPSDCNGVIKSEGYNLIGNLPQGCSLSGTLTGNITGMDAGILPIADNGGPTLTHALSPSSLAIDAGNPTGCVDQSQSFDLDIDQRGYDRPIDGGSGIVRCDIGAYEFKEMVYIYLPVITR